MAALGICAIGLLDDAGGVAPLAKVTMQAAAGVYFCYRASSMYA